MYRITPRLQTSTSGPSYFFPCRVTELHYPAAHWFITTTHFAVLEEEEEEMKMKKKVYRNILNITYSITCTLVHYYRVALPGESIKLCLNMMSLPPFNSWTHIKLVRSGILLHVETSRRLWRGSGRSDWNTVCVVVVQVWWAEPRAHLEEFRSSVRRRPAERVQLTAQRELVTEAEVGDLNVHVGVQQKVLGLRHTFIFTTLYSLNKQTSAVTQQQTFSHHWSSDGTTETEICRESK